MSGDEPEGWFSDQVRLAGWLVLHCGIEDARAFLRMPAGPERDLIVAAVQEAVEHHRDEADYLAHQIAAAIGGSE